MSRRSKLIMATCMSAAALVAAVPLAMSASSARPGGDLSRPIVPLKIFKGRTQTGSGSTNMTQHGGSVETTPAVYAVFWGSWWNTATTTGTDTANGASYSYTNQQAMTYIKDFFSGIGGTGWAGVNTQYCQGVAVGTVNCGTSGTHVTNPTGQLAGSMIDTTNAVPSSPTQSQIAAEAVYGAKQLGVAIGSQPGATVIVFTPSGHSMSGFRTSWCAWHSVTSTSAGKLPYAYMPYQPDAAGNCGENFVNKTPTAYGNGYFDGFSVVGGHEYAEAVTDPITSSGAYAWYDGSGAEIGDKCAWNAASTNVAIGANQFAVQPLWSNIASGCVLS